MNTAKLRTSQIVTTFGIGSIFDAPQQSLIIGGQEDWNLNNTNEIFEPLLQKKLNKDSFRIPHPLKKDGSNAAIAAFRFPRWHFCPKCKRLADILNFGAIDQTNCMACSKPKNPQRLVPARFVIACEKGHISDFPWFWWVHRGAPCKNPKLQISTTGRSASLASIFIKCLSCEAKQSLEKIFDPKELSSIRCQGDRPWLRDKENCGDNVIVLQRGATNVYFNRVESAISIPPLSSSIHRIIEKHWISLKIMPEDDVAAPLLRNIASVEKKSFDDLWQAFVYRRNLMQGNDEPDIRGLEYQALSNPDGLDLKSEFAAEIVPVQQPHDAWLEKVVLVHRLRIVTALRSFSRVSPGATPAPLSKSELNWLPGCEVRGEGIFLRLKASAVKAWLDRAGQIIKPRVDSLEQKRASLIARGLRTLEENVTPELLLVHTLSHQLVRALTLDCGYSSSALRERLYVRAATEKLPALLGLLIYTASADSEGSLGGLVDQGRPSRFAAMISNALETVAWCSNDPLCIEADAQGTNSLNKGACHSCSLLPETACELFNGFLDRAILIGTRKHPQCGFLSPVP